MNAFLTDLRAGARSLAKEPGSALVSVVILALGIGLSTGIFSLAYGVFFRGLDVPEPDRIAVLRVDTRQGPDALRQVRGQDFLDYRERLRSFTGLAAYRFATVYLADDEGPERLSGAAVTANVFDVLRVTPALGRSFLEGEDAPGLAPTVVIGHHVWRDRYGSDPEVLGRSVRVNGEAGTIVGVMPEGFRWPSAHDVWFTLDDDPRASARGEEGSYVVVARLADGVGWDRAEAEVAGVARQLEQEHPESNEGLSARLLTVSQDMNGEEITMIFGAMMVAVLFVLIVACANVANLLLARASTRIREAAVRVSLGAPRRRVMAPFVAEAVVLAGVGALLGTALAYQGVAMFDQATATPITGRPYFMEFEVDTPVLLFVLGLTVFTALLAGIAPALQVSRADVNHVLKDEVRGSSSLHLGRLSRALVFVEVALSVALLVGAGLMVRSIVGLSRYELPFETDDLLSARVSLVPAGYSGDEERLRMWEELERRVVGLPSVQRAALATRPPGGGASWTRIRLEGEEYAEPGDRPLAHQEVVTPGYFDLLGVGIVEGEGFGSHHTRDADPVAIVNESFARRFFPDGSALGRRFRTGESDTIPWMTVVGVVPDLQMQGFQPAASPGAAPQGYYVPVAQAVPSALSLVARPRTGAPLSIAQEVRDVVRLLDRDLPLYDVSSLSTEIARDRWFYAVFGTVFIVFGVAALFMAAAGLYGVLSFSVSQRTREMGIRMALGAGGRQVVRLVLRQGAVQIGVGLVAGLVLAFLVSNVVANLIFQVDPRDPGVFAGVVAVILAVGLAASFVPAWRATSVDPAVALRSD